MRFKLQNVPVTNTANLQTHPDLFVKTASMLVFDKVGKLQLFAHQKYDFSTYLGTLSAGKWREYADIDNAGLHIDVTGDYLVRIWELVYDSEFRVAEKTLAQTLEASGQSDIDISASLACDVIGFEIMPLADAVLNEAFYYTDVDAARVRAIELSIAITTCRKEDYVRNNVRLLDELMGTDEALAGHLQVHVVDNGRTLDELPVESGRVFLHPNPNTGGAGGFARGMMESLDTRFGVKATHVLVMDDDVEVLPEAFVRTYNLLALVRDEYAPAVIAGAMLSLPVRDEQWEDVGCMRFDGMFGPVKRKMKLSKLNRVVENESIVYNRLRQYSAFWYSCVPAELIEEFGLPLPFFIRCDDAEFGMREPQRTFMTMNGICVWHMSFGPSKFRASMECFYVVRNSLIIGAVSPSLQGAGYADLYTTLADDMIEREWRKLAYDNVELCLDGMEAYLDGPAALIARDAEKQFLDYGKKNTPPVELDLQAEDLDRSRKALWKEPRRGFVTRAITKATKNGHRFVPKRFISGSGAAPDEFLWAPNTKVFMKERVYFIEEDGVHGRLHVRDQERFNELWKRYTALTKRYKNEHASIEEEWRQAYPYLKSATFWKEYLAEQQACQDSRK